jgi:hypothetical protein
MAHPMITVNGMTMLRDRCTGCGPKFSTKVPSKVAS